MIIHERALVHPGAQIGSECVIGPDAIIDEHVSVGAGTEVRARAILTGHTRIGEGNQIGYNAIIGAEPQDASYAGAPTGIVIGDRNVIRENCTIHRGTAENSTTILGDENFLMVGVHVAHNCELGSHITLVNNTLLGGYVTIEDHAFLGGDVVVHQHVRIGQGVMVRGQTRLGMDVPPFCMAAETNTVVGLNRVGLKRRGFTEEQRRTLQKAFDILYRQGNNRDQAIKAMRFFKGMQTPEVEHFVRFLESTQRGLCEYRGEVSSS